MYGDNERSRVNMLELLQSVRAAERPIRLRAMRLRYQWTLDDDPVKVLYRERDPLAGDAAWISNRVDPVEAYCVSIDDEQTPIFWLTGLAMRTAGS